MRALCKSVPARQVLGKVGQGYAPMQLRLNVRRLQMGARCVGIARRALSMLCEQAQQRIVDIVRRLEETGEVIISGRGGDDNMVV